MRTFSRTRRLVAAVLLACFQPACSTFQTTDLAPQEALEGQEQVILTVADSTGERVIHLANPWATADSIGGVPCDQHFNCSGRSTLGVPLSSVQKLEVKRSDKKATMGLVAVIAAAGLVVFMAAMMSSWEETWGQSSPF